MAMSNSHHVINGTRYQTYYGFQADDTGESRFFPDWNPEVYQRFDASSMSEICVNPRRCLQPADETSRVVLQPDFQPRSPQGPSNTKSEYQHGLQYQTEHSQATDPQDSKSLLPIAVDSVEPEPEHETEPEPESEDDSHMKQNKASKEKKQPKVVLKSVPIEKLEDYWYWMFDALTQKGVKTILHAWISSCHPGKQTKYPYKGHRKAKPSSDADAYNSTFNQGYHSAPEYWPNQEGWYKVDYTACRHLEPYHIYKNGQ